MLASKKFQEGGAGVLFDLGLPSRRAHEEAGEGGQERAEQGRQRPAAQHRHRVERGVEP